MTPSKQKPSETEGGDARGKGSRAGRVSVGHPVDVASGVLFHEFEDFTLTGRMELVMARRYSSARTGRCEGMFGEGWSSAWEMRLWPDADGYSALLDDGETEVSFDDIDAAVERGGTVRTLGMFCSLHKEDRRYVITRWDPDGEGIERFVFSGAGAGPWLLVARENARGDGVDVTRDDAGRVVALTQRRERRQLVLAYDDAGRVVAVHVRAPVLDGRGKAVSGQHHEREVLRYGYDAKGRLGEMQDAAGQRCEYRYDEAGRLCEERNIGGMVFRFAYDEAGRCIETGGIDGLGLERLEYHPEAAFTLVTNSEGTLTRYEVNAAGQVERETRADGSAATTVYDDYGRIVEMLTAGGARTAYTYDARGDRVDVVAPTGAVTRFAYDASHRLTAVTDPEGGQWTREHDSAGRVAAVSNPLGETLRYRYDARGDLATLTNPADNPAHYTYDDAGNLTAASDFRGQETRYSYDAEGRLLWREDALGHRTRAELDALGRVRAVTLPDGARRRWAWNAFDQPVRYVDELDAETRWVYGPCGRPMEVMRADGGVVAFDWGTVPERLLSVTNARGEVHHFEYDAVGRLIAEQDFAGRKTRYEVDADGQVEAVVDAADKRTKVARDASGQVVQLTYAEGGQDAEVRDPEIWRYAYDARGLLVEAATPETSVTRQYDAAGRLVAEEQDGQRVESRYDGRGYRVARRGPFGDETEFCWDENGQLAAWQPTGLTPLQFGYDARQSEVARTVPHGVHLGARYDARGRRTNTTVHATVHAAQSEVSALIARQYGYDAASNLTDVLDNRWGPARYTYDAVGRIVGASLPGGLQERFSYDHDDNITSAERQGGTETPLPQTDAFAYEAGGQLVRRGDTTYRYDALGRLIEKQHGKKRTTYRYNTAGQLVEAHTPSGARWHYRYDALGRRVEKHTQGRRVRFIWDGDVVLHEVHEGHRPHDDPDASPRPDPGPKIITWEYEPDSFAPIAKIEDGQRYLCVNDLAGNPNELVTDTGAVAWRARFSSWGENLQTDPNSTVDCPVRYQGQWYDDETGLHYNRFRYYDPEAGRYTTPDPIGLLGGINLHAYAPNASGWVDPYGLTKKCPTDEGGVPQSEKFYRTMSGSDYQHLVQTGKLRATSETFTSPTRSFSESYQGVLVEFRVKPGTTEALTSIGVRDNSAVAQRAHPGMPPVSKGWTSQNAFFKGEGPQVNIGLGRGTALEIFNQNIESFQALLK